MFEITKSADIQLSIAFAFHASVPYMSGCIMAKGLWKLAVYIVVAYKVKLMYKSILFLNFLQDPSGNCKESGTCKRHWTVTEQGAFGRSM